MPKIILDKKRKIIFAIIGTAILVALCLLFVYLKQVSDYKQAVKNITIEDVDISKQSDSGYIGECNVNFIYAKVKVSILDGKIENINLLEHKNEKGQSAEIIIDNIVAEQKIDVDAIAGATNSSIVIKKAVENAFSVEK